MTPSLDVVSRALVEAQRARTIHPTWPTDIIHAVAVMNEEAGEAVKAANEAYYRHKGTMIEDVYTETIHTMAMCIRLLTETPELVAVLEKHKSRTSSVEERLARIDRIDLHPIVVALRAASLPKRVVNAIRREFDWDYGHLGLLDKSLEQFVEELHKKNGGKVKLIRNLGAIGISQLRAVFPLEDR